MSRRVKSLDDVARSLELHPFDVARILGHVGELPPGLRFDNRDVDRVRELAGIERWWTGMARLPDKDPARSGALVQGLARNLLQRDRVGSRTTRADNLLRGLDGADRKRLRRTINTLIRERVLRTSSSWRGLQLSVEPQRVPVLRALQEGQSLAAALRAQGGRQ